MYMSVFHRAAASGSPVKLTRRGFLGLTLGTLALASGLPKAARAADAPGTRVPAFIEINPDGTIRFLSPFVEGGQGIFTAMAQIVGEELDADPQSFRVENAPAGPDYGLMGGMRFTGGSNSVRGSYDTMRKLGASARAMLLEAAAKRLGVDVATLSTEPGVVVHAASGRTLAYGDLSADAAALPVPAAVTLKDPANFRWIGKPVARLDVRAKSTGKAEYAIDLKVEGMLQAAVQHAPRVGAEVASLANEDAVKAMPGVHSVHRLPGAVAVVAERWWQARRAVETLQVSWSDPATPDPAALPADFSSAAFRDQLAATAGPGAVGESVGDATAALASAVTVIEATYDAPFLAHAQLEPPSALARFNADGTLDLWVPNQAPEFFQGAAAGVAGITPDKINIHSPLLGGFFGRHFIYVSGNPFPQAILLAKAVGRPVKVIWSREEEFMRDALRPMSVARFRAALDANGKPLALSAEAIGEGPIGRWFGRAPDKADSSAIEGIAEKPYAIANRLVSQVYVPVPTVIGFWRSVGHSMNDFFYETFFDEMADAGKQDPFELRRELLGSSPRHKALIEAVAELSGGWKRGPFEAEDGSRRARGVAMASPFGSEVATIAEVSIKDGAVVVHDVWVAIDPGRAINPAIIEAQVQSSVALGLSSALLEELAFEAGMPQARNFDGYPILPPDRMPKVHVQVVESGEPLGGVGEPGLPGVPPAVANAVAALTGKRIRSLPMSKVSFEEQG